MKYLWKITLALFLIIIGLIFYTFISTGYFRTLENKVPGEVWKKIKLSGAEDIMVNRKDSFAIVSSTQRNFGNLDKPEISGLYLIDLKAEEILPILLTEDFKKPFAPHGISMLQSSDSTYTIMAVNHTGKNHSIEVFELYKKKCAHTKTISDPSIKSPNDIVMIDQHRFYFTNDHGYVKGLGKWLEEYGGLSVSNVVYFDGQEFNEVANKIAYANGINFDSTRNLLFVASPRKFIVKVFETLADGNLKFIEDIYCGTGVDNIEFDVEGKLWIGCHPSLLKFASYAKGKSVISPSEIITIEYRSKGDYDIKSIFVDDGHLISASTVAVKFGKYTFIGNVDDDSIVVLKE